MSLSIVVPVFNSAATLDELVSGLLAAIRPLGDAVEVLLVDDASSDDSWTVIRELASVHQEVRGLRMARNVGEQNAVLCGILNAGGRIIATIDDDLQQPPGALPALVAAMDEDVDVVYGTARRYRHGVPREIVTSPTKWALEKGFGVPGARRTTSFRVFRSALRDSFPDRPGPLCSIDGLLRSATSRIIHVPVDHHRRRTGRSQYTTTKLVAHTSSVIVGGSVSPLRFCGVVGAAYLVAALVAVGWSVARYLLDGSVSAFWAVVVLLLVLGGSVLVALWILGEFAVRILARVAGVPAFVVAESAGQV